jgi:hypothetical protein
MPGFAHICISIGLSVFLFKITSGKFSIKHAIIFIVNSLVGPDAFGLFSGQVYLFFHGYGWFVAALPITFGWMIYARYHVQWKPFKVWKLDASKEWLITLPEIYCLISAGGIFHQLVDIIGHPSFIWYNGVANVPWGVVWFGDNVYFSSQSILGTGLFPCGDAFGFVEYYITLVIFLGATLLCIFFIMRRNKKSFYLASLVLVAAYFVTLAIAWFIPVTKFNVNQPGVVNYYGDPNFISSTMLLTGGEADFGVLLYFGLFLFVPLILLYFSYAGIPRVPKQGYRAIVEKVESEARQTSAEKIKELVEGKDTTSS